MSAYSLGRACWIVRKLDGSAGRRAVFEDVVRKNPIIRFFYVLYGNSPEFLKSLLLLLYSLKCYLSLKWGGDRRIDIAFFASYPNERVVLNHLGHQLAGRLGGLRQGSLAIGRANCLGLEALRALPAFIANVPRLYRLAGKYVRRFHFMPACREISVITYYMRFRRLLAASDPEAVFIANHYSPECLALATAAHAAGRKVIFTNHANATWIKGFVPPLYCDLAAVTSQAVLDVYRAHSDNPFEVVFVPLAVPQRPLRTRIDIGRPITIGIFLTALTRTDRLGALVAQLEAYPWVGRILIRPHPVKAIKEDLSGICNASSRTSESGDLSLFANIAECDFAICGNSSVPIEILRAGVPVFYDHTLDCAIHDLNRFLNLGLVPALPLRLDQGAFDALAAFYGKAAWREAMAYFDASYQKDEAAMIQRLSEAVRAIVCGAEAREAGAGPRGHPIETPARAIAS